jgi:hypothetical protein
VEQEHLVTLQVVAVVEQELQDHLPQEQTLVELAEQELVTGQEIAH